MPFNIEATPEFLSEAKKLAKKYPSPGTDIGALANQLIINLTMGTPLGKDAYKIRMAIASKGKGKKRRRKDYYLC